MNLKTRVCSRQEKNLGRNGSLGARSYNAGIADTADIAGNVP
jgi:hypothetical protein